MSRVIEGRLPCPECTSSDAYHLYDDGHGYCYSCTYFKPAREDFLQETFTYEYYPHRGLNRSTLEFYDIKAKVDKDGRPVCVGFKYPFAVKVRSLSEKTFWWEPPGSVKPGLFGRDRYAAGERSSCTITEGEYDAASLYQVVGGPAGSAVVSVQSSSSALRDATADRSWIDAHDRIYLAFDNDTAGKAALKDVAKLFDYNKLYVLNFDKRKDANEFLQAKEGEQLRHLWLNAKRYLPETVVSVNKDNIKELLGEEPKMGVPYPFPSLNEMTYGIRKGESVLITAPEGYGKTQLMHAIEFQLLKETSDGVGAIFLEETKRDHLRALAGIQCKHPTHLPHSGCSEADIVDAVNKSVGADDRLHLYNHFGSDDPLVLLDTIRFMVVARSVAYVLLDHIGMCVSGLVDEKDERRALDYISTRLAMMIKELNFALIMVSHVNDNGQTRGSRLIGKDCHVRIDLSRDLASTNPKVLNTVELSVSKNRPIGKTGFAGQYLFDPVTRQYTELRAANDNAKLEAVA